MNEQELRQKIVEKAWSDEAFKAKLLANPVDALNEAFGLSIPEDYELVIVEETSNKFGLVIPQNPSEVIKNTNNVEYTW